MYVLESEYGNEGYAFYYKLLELLCVTDGHFYEYGNATSKRFMLAKMKISEEAAGNILDTLAEIGEIDLELWQEDQVIWSDGFLENVADVYKRRHCDFPAKPSLCKQKLHLNGVSVDNNPPSAIVSVNKNTQSKVEYSKPNQSRLEESIAEESRGDEIRVEETKKEEIIENHLEGKSSFSFSEEFGEAYNFALSSTFKDRFRNDLPAMNDKEVQNIKKVIEMLESNGAGEFDFKKWAKEYIKGINNREDFSYQNLGDMILTNYIPF